MEDLTERQSQIYAYIKQEVKKRNYPPSVREIGKAVGLSSSSTVHSHLASLESKGYIKRDPTKPRAIELLEGKNLTNSNLDNNLGNYSSEIEMVPVLGEVSAGVPILAQENIQEYFPVPSSMTRGASVFMLQVKGDSMIEAGINDADYVIVRQQSSASNGEIVVAIIEDEATVKRYFLEKDGIRLQPENSAYTPIISKDTNVVGKVVGVFRYI